MSLYEGSIDDNDAFLVYSSGWELVTSDGQWTGTMHSTSVVGASVRVRFTGSRVAVICTIPTGSGASSMAAFSVDDEAAAVSSHQTTGPVQRETVFWDSGPLDMGPHLLAITNVGAETYFRLDRIDYDPTDSIQTPIPLPDLSLGQSLTNQPATLPSLIQPNTPSSISTGSPALLPQTSAVDQGAAVPSLIVTVSAEVVTSILTGSSQSASQTVVTFNGVSAVAASSKSRPSSTVLVASILGTLLGIVLLAIVILLLIRRRRRHRLREDYSIPTPFLPPAASVPRPLHIQVPNDSRDMSSTQLVNPADRQTFDLASNAAARGPQEEEVPRSATPTDSMYASTYEIPDASQPVLSAHEEDSRMVALHSSHSVYISQSGKLGGGTSNYARPKGFV